MKLGFLSSSGMALSLIVLSTFRKYESLYIRWVSFSFANSFRFSQLKDSISVKIKVLLLDFVKINL